LQQVVVRHAAAAVGEPARIGFERGAAARAVFEALVAPQVHHLVQRADVAAEVGQRLAQVLDLDGPAFARIALQEGRHGTQAQGVGTHFDNHFFYPMKRGSSSEMAGKAIRIARRITSATTKGATPRYMVDSGTSGSSCFS